MTASFPCRVLSKACIWCVYCIGACIVRCIEVIMVGLLHPFLIWLPMVCDQWLHELHGQNNSDENFPIHVVGPLSMLLYLVSALDGLLLAKAMVHNGLLSGASSYWQVIPSLTCSNLATRPTPHVSPSKHSGSFSF